MATPFFLLLLDYRGFHKFTQNFPDGARLQKNGPTQAGPLELSSFFILEGLSSQCLLRAPEILDHLLSAFLILKP
jgi:hypothetical protein